MPKLPEPPDESRLRELGPRLAVLPSGTELWRVYFRGGEHPTEWNAWRYYGPVDARFDHHIPPPHLQERGALYCAAEIVTCLAEVFQRRRLVDRNRGAPWLVGFSLARDVALQDLSGTWPTAAGASMAIGTGPHMRAQRWSRAIYEGYPIVQGLLYCSSMHANRPAVMLYERAVTVLPTLPFFHRALADPLLLLPLKRAAAELGYGLA